MELSTEIKEILEELKNIRRDLHKIPELGLEEYKTSQYIKEYLQQLNIKYEENVLETGIIAYFEGREPKKTYCFRADIDALGMQEQNQLEYQSVHVGKMHACGHDGHIAIVLGLAKLLTKNKDKLKDNIVLLFQPAEEGPGGALPILEGGFLKKYGVEEIYGLHLFPGLQEGQIGLRPGAMMSQNGEFDILIKGQSAHGAMPHVGIDSVVVASEMALGMQSIVSRSINPIEPAVITIGRVEAGEKRNIIAEEAVLEGTIRTFNQETYDLIKKRMMDFKKGLEVNYQCKIDIVIRDMYPAVYNDSHLTEIFIEAQKKCGIDVEIIDPIMLAEDFSFYQREIPGLFFFLGTKNKEKGFTYPLHNGKFNFDEKVLGDGLQIFVNLLKHRDIL
ncbi:M20 metallopeptidase family protein [Clostridium formicaceticum]|uniref:Amidohydrolase n=1 Tax=Clostridium formicaceticum TaxID=1497 RepID=A0AAC9RJQ1_9CLOT|nr:M20 family metallopeptidase [Clostridium formicaceticum]AOY76363.1 amidohydrolase [Clostridium formicaceticum]ARE86755.1 N-acetyldiaminopimelate deacetylase [Clostridium formicaceticum]